MIRPPETPFSLLRLPAKRRWSSISQTRRDVMARNDRGLTTLHAAAFGGTSDSVKLVSGRRGGERRERQVQDDAVILLSGGKPPPARTSCNSSSTMGRMWSSKDRYRYTALSRAVSSVLGDRSVPS